MKTSVSIRLWLMLLCVWYLAACNRQDNDPAAPQSLTSSNITMPDRNAPGETVLPDAAATVYVCKSSGAKKYHLNQNCHGLKRCKHEVVEMKVKDAEGRGLGLCGYED